MTRRGRPRLENPKSNAQSAKNYRRRREYSSKPAPRPTYCGDNPYVLKQRYNVCECNTLTIGTCEPIDYRKRRLTGYGPHIADTHYWHANFDRREYKDWSTQNISDDNKIAIDANVSKAIDDDRDIDHVVAISTDYLTPLEKTDRKEELSARVRERLKEEEEKQYYERLYTGPRCQLAVPMHGLRALGQMVDIEPTEIVEPTSYESVTSYQIDDWKECRSIVSEYTYRVARGNADSAYVATPSYQIKRPHNWNADPYEPYKERPYAKRKTEADLITGEWKQIVQANATILTAKVQHLADKRGIRRSGHPERGRVRA
jgi:hypothetical protein